VCLVKTKNKCTEGQFVGSMFDKEIQVTQSVTSHVYNAVNVHSPRYYEGSVPLINIQIKSYERDKHRTKEKKRKI